MKKIASGDDVPNLTTFGDGAGNFQIGAFRGFSGFHHDEG